MKKLKPIPSFETEAQERKFWETHDSTDYLDLSKAQRKCDVPYQSLIKMWLAEKVR
jgi:hypothetical protein